METRSTCLMLLLFSMLASSSSQDQCDVIYTTLTCDGSKSNLSTFPTLDLCGMCTRIRIINTNLTDLQSGNITLPTFPQLRILDLSFNGIRILNISLVENNVAIEMLKLVDNKLRSVPKDILERTLQLKYIDISRNFIETIEEFSFHRNNYLQYLNLKDNHIHSIHKYAFWGLGALQFLHLSSNDINEFPFKESGYNFPHLKRITLSKNNISRLTRNLDGYPACKTLFLNQNILQSLDNYTLANFPLVYLNLDNNFISRTATFLFGGLQHNLTALSLSFNFLTVIPISFLRQLPYLRSINLDYNRLTRIPQEAFKSNSYLQSISLAYNSIHLVHSMAFVGLERLTDLDLGNNNHTILPDELFDPEEDFEIQLSGNNWTCDCEVSPVIEWLKKSKYFVNDVECWFKTNENTSYLMELPFEDICSGTEANLVTTGLPATDTIDTTRERTVDVTEVASGRQAEAQLNPFLVTLLTLFILLQNLI